jgi:hypothetical protein
VSPDHPDFPLVSRIGKEIERLAGGSQTLGHQFPLLVQDAVDFVVDPIRTARTHISDLDSVEKTFVGLKIEHFLRDFLGVPKQLRDLRIDGLDVDVKNTVSNTWMIPPETFANSDPCVLVMVATVERTCSLGVIQARPEYLNAPNRDGKRGVRAASFENVLWLLRKAPLPESRFAGLDMARFRELRRMKGGTKRAAQFFREHLRKVVHRVVLHGLLYDQDDYMKRLRGNSGARDVLNKEGIALLSGAYHSSAMPHFGLAPCGRDEFCAVEFDQHDIPMLHKAKYFERKGG